MSRMRTIVMLLTFGAVSVFSILSHDAPALSSGSITSPDTEGHVGYGPSLVLDSLGRPVVSYIDATNQQMKLLRCDDVNCAPGGDSIHSLDVVGALPGNSSLALDSAGNPVISYHDSDASELKIKHCNDAACAPGGDILAVADSAGFVGAHSDLALDSGGDPVVAYWDQSGNSLNLLRCDDPVCLFGGESITSPGIDGYDLSLALDSAGNPVVAYSETAMLRLLHCNDPLCAGGDDSIETVDAPGVSGWSISLVLDAGGFPVISYHDFVNGGLKVAHCNDVNCASGDEAINVVDSAENAGNGSSLALDASGNPVIAYTDEDSYVLNNYRMKIVHCDDPDCAAGGDVAVIPDTFGPNAGGSLALDGAGNPVVAYLAYGVEDLKLLHCGTPSCLQFESDGDGCPDKREQQTAAGSELTGGRRDFNDPHDYFNPTQDGQNRVDDILAAVNAYFMHDNDGNPGLPPYQPGYNPNTDRSNLAASPNAWNTGAPDGLQRVQDILHAVNSYFHDCS